MRKKNSIAVLLLVMFLFYLAGCGGSGSNNNPGQPKDPATPGDPVTPVNPVKSSYPQSIQVEEFDGRLVIKFTAVCDWAGVDCKGGIVAKYDLRYATSDYSNNLDHVNVRKLGENVLGRDLDSNGDFKGPVYGEITELTNDVKYYIWINSIFDTVGKSDYVMATGTPVPLPSAPTGVTATAGEESINVAWTPVKYASSYEISYYTDNKFSDVPAGNRKTTQNPEYTLNGLTNGTLYYIWVRAHNGNGYSTPSAVEEALPGVASGLPGAVGPLTVNHGAKRVTVSWDRVPGASYYELHWTDSASVKSWDVGACESDPQCKIVMAAGSTVSASITGLTNNTEYAVWVIAANSAGASESSPIIRETPKPKSEELPINFSNVNFQLGVSTAQYIFGENRPKTPFPREGFTDNLHRAKETPLGNLFTDGAMWYLNERLDPEPGKKVDFVFLNSAHIDSSFSSPGAVTVRTLMAATGGSRDEIIILEMKGSDIKALFDYAAANAPHMGFRGRYETVSSGHWPIVSKEVNYTLGYKYVDKEFMKKGFNTITPAEAEPYYLGIIKAGTLKLNGANLENDKIYRIATTDWNEDGFYVKPMDKALNKEYTDIIYWHAVAEYIYDYGSITPTAVDGRIQIEGGPPGGPLGVYEGFNRYCPIGSTYDEDSGCIFE